METEYEMMYIVKPISDGLAHEVNAKMSNLIEKLGGRVKQTDFWGKKRLAYEIQDFAEKAAEKVRKLRHTSWESSFSPDPVSVPGLPAEKNYGGYFQPQDRHGISIDIRKVKPKSNPQKCLHSADCHLCADVCPMGAIDPSDITRIPGICIKCGACTKKCPAQAMYFDDPGYLYHKSELEDLYRRRADNAFFL